MAHPIPQSPDEFTPELLTALLAEANPGFPQIRSLVVEPMATDAITSTLARVRVAYRGQSEVSRPESFVCKRSLDDPLRRASFIRGYRNEVAFYREIAPRVSIRVPVSYYAAVDENTGAHVLLLEDVDGTRSTDTDAGATVEEARAFLREIAALHAAYWGRATASYYANTDTYVDFYRSVLERGIEYLEPHLDTELRSIGSRVGDHLAGWMTLLAAGPQTIVHGDAHGGNVLFTNERVPRSVILDWQGWHGDAGIRDVSRFLTLGLATAARRDAEDTLLGEYHEALATRGATYSTTDIRRDYWIGVAMQWVWAVTFSRYEAQWTGGLRDLMDVLVPRALEGFRDAAAAGVFE